MKIVDSFIFNNEIELLKTRLYELYDIVDYFILVEGTHTFTGNSKKLYYNDNKDLFLKYSDKIIHIIVDDFPTTTNPWDREHYQRRAIHKGIERISLDNNDVIIISDIDEIPNSEIIKSIKNNTTKIDKDTIYSLVMSLYYYTIDWTTNRKWYHVKLLTNEKYNTIKDPELIRSTQSYVPINNGGWHITYYGDHNFIINKLESFSEQQDNNTKNKNPEYLNSCIKDGILHFNNEKLIKNTDYDYLPSYFKKIPKLAFTFWEGTQLSNLNYLTIYSFSKYNPDYKIIIYYSNKEENFSHYHKEASEITKNKIHASNYNFNETKCIPINKLTEIDNIELINIDIEKEYKLEFETSPIHKADIVRIAKLYEHGGLWFDLDILFLKPIPENIRNSNKDILSFTYSNTIATGLIVSTPKNKAISLIFDKCLEKIRNQAINADWQQFGPTLWHNCFINNPTIFNNCEFLNNDEIYPYMWYEPQLFFFTNNNKIKENTWGIHWYNGHIESRKFIDTFIFDTKDIDKNKSVFYNCLFNLFN